MSSSYWSNGFSSHNSSKPTTSPFVSGFGGNASPSKMDERRILEQLEKKPIFNNTIADSNSNLDGALRNTFVSSTEDGSTLVTLKGNYLRWGNIQKEGFSTMHIEPIGKFSDRTVVISQSRNRICLYNKHYFKSVEIPWGYSDIQAHMAFEFQTQVFNLSQKASIKQIMFHPRASDDDTLVILLEDDTIVLFDMKSEKSIVLNEAHGALGLNSRIEDINSISFSKDGLTLYLLSVTDGGDVYALFPCLPATMELEKTEIKQLMEKAVLLYDSLKPDTPDDVKKNIIKQFKFISNMHMESSKSGKTEFAISETFRDVKPQGPFTISPYPEKLYETTAQDIFTVPVGASSEVLLMLFENGTVLVLFKDLEMTMCWDCDNYTHSNSLVLVEQISEIVTSAKGAAHLDIFRQFNEPDRALLFSRSESRVILLDMSRWAGDLDKAISNSNASSLKDVAFKSALEPVGISQVSSLSVAVWRLKGKSGVVIPCQDKVSAILYNFPLGEEEAVIVKEESPVLPEEAVKLEPEFSQPLMEINNYSTAYVRRCKNPLSEVIPPNVRQENLANASNEKQLAALTKLSSQIAGIVIQGQSLGVMLHSRLVEQQYEFSKQLKSTNDMIEKQDLLMEKLTQQSLVLNEKMARQNSVAERLVALNSKVAEANAKVLESDNVISDEEVAWFKEIRAQVYKFNEFVNSQSSLRAEMDFVKQQLATMRERSRGTRDKTEQEWSELRNMLEADGAVIKQCNDAITADTTTEGP
ncbi:linker nucleoporin [Maudiozyma humilis]|uniref:Linker nucleoporin n=1 Tax=Maudiozyma humilis TaxID=51915 RepID=A0AAV5S178_MAUHU|nr:linker nucleoporin [Kazachstania humilis]